MTAPAPSFTCGRCGMTSTNPIDRAEGYCGNCHDWTAGPSIYRRKCPQCGLHAEGNPYDVGDGPELSCSSCEWCWGAIGQPLTPIPSEVAAAVAVCEILARPGNPSSDNGPKHIPGNVT